MRSWLRSRQGFIYDEDRIVHELVTPEENPRLKLPLQILEEEVDGQSLRRLSPSGGPAHPDQGARRLRSGVDQRAA